MIKFANIWVLLILALFYFGSVSWPGAQEPWTALLVIASLLAFNLGWYLTSVPQSSVFTDLVKSRTGTARRLLTREVSFVVLITLAILTAISIEIGTGRSMFALSSWSLDHAAVYESFQVRVQNIGRLNTGQQIVIIAKSILTPVGLVVFALHFRTYWWTSALFLLPIVASAFMRGTDKETFDAALLTLIAMLYYKTGRRLLRYAPLFVVVVIWLFIDRKVARYGGQLPTCLPNTLACMNYDSMAAKISPNLEFGLVILTSYLTNGYQGLAYAFHLPHDFTWGVGHLPPIKRIICQTAKIGCDTFGYNERLIGVGWDTRFRWSSAYTTLADDFSFYGIPLYMLFLGRATKLAEAAWATYKDPISLATLMLIGMFFAYSSANMQIAISLEWATAWIALVYLGHLFVPPSLSRRRT